MTLDVGLVPSSEDVLFEGIFSLYRIWSSEEQFLAFIPYKLRKNKRAEGTCINIY
jgi:hypothetical protein